MSGTGRPKSVRKEAFYPYSPERVWVALTDPRALAEWLMPNTFRPVLGHEFEFRYDVQPFCGSGRTVCRVLEIDAPRRMVWSWTNVPRDPGQPMPPAMRVEWTLTRERNGTRLVLVHSGLEHESWFVGLMMRFGWGTMVSRWLPRVVANVAGDESGVFTPGAIPLEKRCYTCRTIPAEFVR
ncbi:MAG: SRPBCC domain-containing protein [Phycisphaerae bacterium]|nr:SRPBCC domain-containing protein [Phycisphaerae bacterium]